jgi:excisionase family DNA binding protein
MNHHDDALISTQQLAERLGVSLRTLERMRHTGEGPAFHRVSGGMRRGRVMYREGQVRAWLDRREYRSTVSVLASRGEDAGAVAAQ